MLHLLPQKLAARVWGLLPRWGRWPMLLRSGQPLRIFDCKLCRDRDVFAPRRPRGAPIQSRSRSLTSVLLDSRTTSICPRSPPIDGVSFCHHRTPVGYVEVLSVKHCQRCVLKPPAPKLAYRLLLSAGTCPLARKRLQVDWDTALASLQTHCLAICF